MSTTDSNGVATAIHGGSSIGKYLFPASLMSLLDRLDQKPALSTAQTAQVQAELVIALEDAKSECIKSFKTRTGCKSCKTKGLVFEPAPATLELKNKLVNCVERFHIGLLKQLDQERADKLITAFDKVERLYWKDHMKTCSVMEQEEKMREAAGEVGPGKDVDT